jgi:Outer membrane protein beta-barrel domain
VENLMKKMLLAALLVACGATTASADPLMKYTYLDTAYQWTHLDTTGLNDSNGVDVKGSYAILDNVALEGGYNYINSGLTGASINVNQNTFRYGASAWHSFCNGVDLVGRVGGTHVGVNSSIGDASENGVYAGATARYLLTDTLEGNLDALYDSATSLTNITGANWTYSGTLLQTVADNVAVKAGVGIDSEQNVAITAGVRLAM